MNRYGMNWIRQDKRLAIYLRDGLACVYCELGIESGLTLTLDHLKPRTNGGSNAARNLVTACRSCNSARKDRPVAEFARSRGDPGIRSRVRNARRRRIDPHKVEARSMIRRRGSAAKALKKTLDMTG